MAKTLRSPRHLALMCALKEARMAAGLTQHQLAETLGKPQSFVAKIEGGERRLDVVEFVAVVDALGADGAQILQALREAPQG